MKFALGPERTQSHLSENGRKSTSLLREQPVQRHGGVTVHGVGSNVQAHWEEHWEKLLHTEILYHLTPITRKKKVSSGVFPMMGDEGKHACPSERCPGLLGTSLAAF